MQSYNSIENEIKYYKQRCISRTDKHHIRMCISIHRRSDYCRIHICDFKGYTIVDLRRLGNKYLASDEICDFENMKPCEPWKYPTSCEKMDGSVIYAVRCSDDFELEVILIHFIQHLYIGGCHTDGDRPRVWFSFGHFMSLTNGIYVGEFSHNHYPLNAISMVTKIMQAVCHLRGYPYSEICAGKVQDHHYDHNLSYYPTLRNGNIDLISSCLSNIVKTRTPMLLERLCSIKNLTNIKEVMNLTDVVIPHPIVDTLDEIEQWRDKVNVCVDLNAQIFDILRRCSLRHPLELIHDITMLPASICGLIMDYA